ncbi:MAG: mandelate racemase/muconate lactonizing enzyme family protein [Methylobacterium sp.]|nr:mandelate racemase/muconate lactonizing enzyme family protein [Methylobacterium sp.]MCA3622833.1 mandelate racemase/muconate lactonizing enzyme family protein [Methylobacterium sp.]MCA4921460.1 mandelate racemase/muconate lactonizing enzyme family protein [Methylobacterium sp.]
MRDTIATVESFVITIPRDTPYLGALRPGEEANARGYFVRKGNRTVYPAFDRNVLVRLRTRHGVIGWGETYGIVAPRATMAIIDDLLADFVIGTDPFDSTATHDRLYDLMRVRGYTGGYYLDALAAIDIALWDIAAQIAGRPLCKLLGGQRRETIPAYLSGLPKPSRPARAMMAAEWQAKGFNAFKFAAPVADDGVEREIETLRETLGPKARIACDMHWAQSAAGARMLIQQMEPHGLWFAEAPVNPEDLDGLAEVAASVSTPIAAGEEWRTAFDAQARLARRACAILQPEMGHKGVTEFMRIAGLAQVHHCEMIPHATIGIGIFLAASLHASAAAAAVTAHEFQHSIVVPNARYLDGAIACEGGEYSLPPGAGLGVRPSAAALAILEQ